MYIDKNKNGITTILILVFLSVLVVSFVFWGFSDNSKNDLLRQVDGVDRSEYLMKDDKSHPDESNEAVFKKYEWGYFSVEIPINYDVEEKYNTVTIFTPEGEILIDRIGTNFPNISEHIAAIEDSNKLNFDRKELLEINGSGSMIKYYKSELEDYKSYSIYTTNKVYTILTFEEELYDELDQIALSAQYDYESERIFEESMN